MFPAASVLQQFSGIAGRVPGVGDETVAVVHQIAVCPDDGQALGHPFHAWRIVGAVEALWHLDRTVEGVVGEEEGEGHAGMLFFCPLDGQSRHTVKTPVMAGHKVCDAVLDNLPLHRLGEGGQDFLSGLSVADKETSTAHWNIPLPICPHRR